VVCDSPEQALSYHILGICKLKVSSLTWHLVGYRASELVSSSSFLVLLHISVPYMQYTVNVHFISRNVSQGK
jgi:hypothetical protein